MIVILYIFSKEIYTNRILKVLNYYKIIEITWANYICLSKNIGISHKNN